jgi:DNA-binding response OmpR family regulator
MKILVVDDCKADRELIISHIKKINFKEEIEIKESNSLTNTRSAIKENNYDLIILDLNLPESNGIDTVNEVFETLSKSKKDIPIIVLTGSGSYKLGKKAFKLGIKDYLIKGEDENRELRRAINFATYSRNLPSRQGAN